MGERGAAHCAGPPALIDGAVATGRAVDRNSAQFAHGPNSLPTRARTRHEYTVSNSVSNGMMCAPKSVIRQPSAYTRWWLARSLQGRRRRRRRRISTARFAHRSVGRRSSARTRSTGETSAGALNFRVEPSAPAALGAALVAADGAVGGLRGLRAYAAEIVKAARRYTDHENQTSISTVLQRCWLAECCERQGAGNHRHSHRRQDCIRSSGATDLNRSFH